MTSAVVHSKQVAVIMMPFTVGGTPPTRRLHRPAPRSNVEQIKRELLENRFHTKATTTVEFAFLENGMPLLVTLVYAGLSSEESLILAKQDNDTAIAVPEEHGG